MHFSLPPFSSQVLLPQGAGGGTGHAARLTRPFAVAWRLSCGAETEDHAERPRRARRSVRGPQPPQAVVLPRGGPRVSSILGSVVRVILLALGMGLHVCRQPFSGVHCVSRFCCLNRKNSVFLHGRTCCSVQAEARKQRDEWLRDSLGHLLPPPPPAAPAPVFPAATSPGEAPSAAAAPGLMPLQTKSVATAPGSAASAPEQKTFKSPPACIGDPAAYAASVMARRPPWAIEPAQKAMPRGRQVA